MVPTIEGEFARKRRMMVGLWDIVIGEGMLSPRGYSPLYMLELFSHRLLRYLTPLLHLVALAANVALLGNGWVYSLTMTFQLCFLLAAALRLGRPPGAVPDRPLLRPHHRLDRGRALGPRPPRLAGDLGEGGGDALTLPRAFDLIVSVLTLVVLSPLLLSSRSRSGSAAAARSSTASAASGSTAASSR